MARLARAARRLNRSGDQAGSDSISVRIGAGSGAPAISSSRHQRPDAGSAAMREGAPRASGNG